MACTALASFASSLARAPALARTASRSFVLAALVGTALDVAPCPLAAQGCQPAIEYGMNPSFQTWSSRAIVFADAFQRVRGMYYWSGGPQENAPLIPLGSGRLGEGWPDPAQLPAGQRYGSMLFGQMEGTVPDGRQKPYVVTWEGTGHVMLEGPYVVDHQNRTNQRVEVLIDPNLEGASALLSISWTATDPSDPVRNVHVWLPGMERGNRIFWPPFVTKLREMNAGHGPHTWRTLDWTRVNEHGRPPAAGGYVFDRAGVIRPSSPSQGTVRGVAVEYQVALCNLVGMNLHLQLPHRTKDMTSSDYVAFLREQMRIVRDGSPAIPGINGGRPFAGLDPALTVTVELSNEIWNPIFPVSRWMNLEALRKGIPFLYQVASEIQILFDAARAEFTGPDAARLRTYVGGFSGYPGFVEKILESLRPGTRVDAIGCAAYLGPREDHVDGWLAGSTETDCPNCPDVTELLEVAALRIESLRPQLRLHRKIADRWVNPDGSNAALELYEGGLHLRAHRRPWFEAGEAVQSDPRVFTLLADQYVPMLIEEGVELVNWYSFMSDQDAPTVDAHGVWNDMDEQLTLPVQRPYVHEGLPKAAVICLGPPLSDDCPRARAVPRSALANAPLLTSTPPVLGTTLRARVTPASETELVFMLVSSRAGGELPKLRGAGVDAGSGVVVVPLPSGPSATWEVRVPNDAALAGLGLTIRAALSGGAGVRLSNAVDLTLGR